MEFTLEELCKKLEWDRYYGIAVDDNEPDYTDEILETHGRLKVIDFKVSGNILFVKLEKSQENV